MYNPFSILCYFTGFQVQNYWFATGTPTFLVDLLRERNTVQLSDQYVDGNTFNSYDIRNLETVPLLFQTGYLTIKEVGEYDILKLGYPNREVEQSMMRHLFGEYRHADPGQTGPTILDLRNAFFQNDLALVFERLNAIFASIPHQLFIKEREAYFHSLIYLSFKLLGLYVQAEVSSAGGRADAVVHTPTHIYILEFKLDQSAEKALVQIQEKEYVAPFREGDKIVVAVGVNFNGEEKRIDAWEVG